MQPIPRAIQAALLATLLTALLTATAQATPFRMLPNPVELGGGADPMHATLSLIEITTGIPSAGIVQTGAVAAGNTSLVFQLDFAADDASTGILIQVFGESFTGAGWIPGAEPDALVDVTAVPGSFAPDTATLVYANSPGKKTNLFFTSYANLEIGDFLQFGEAGSALPVGEAVIGPIPEPTGAALFGGGALVAAVATRRRRSNPAN